MKYVRKLIALNLVLVMAFSFLPVSALAAEVLTDTLTYDVTTSGQREYVFTPEEDGLYSFKIETTDIVPASCGNLMLYAPEGNYMSPAYSSNGQVTQALYTVWMEAGKEYTIKHFPRELGEHILSVEKASVQNLMEGANTLYVTERQNQYVSFTPSVGGWYTFHATISGYWNIIGTSVSATDVDYESSTHIMTLISDKETSVYLESDTIYTWVYIPDSDGTSVISISENSVLDSIHVGMPYTIIPDGVAQYYTFTPSEDGNYQIVSDSKIDAEAYIFDNMGKQVAACGSLSNPQEPLSADLYANAVYYIAYKLYDPYGNMEGSDATATLTRRSGLSHETEDSGYCGENLKWDYDDTTRTLNITGTGAMNSYLYELCPWDSFRSQLQAINLPDGLTSIDTYAFRFCTELTSITIPESVTRIGGAAFTGCTSLERVTIGSSLQTIEWHAFSECDSLTDLDLPEGVTTIAYSAFQNCSALQTVGLPKTLKSIERSAFYNDTSISQVTYAGTQAQWNEILIGQNNEDLTDAAFTFQSGGTDFEDITLNDLVQYVPYQGDLGGTYQLKAGESLPGGLVLEEQFVTGVPKVSGSFVVTLASQDDVQEKTLKLVISNPEDALDRNKTDEGYEWINNPQTEVSEDEDLVLVSKGEFDTFQNVYLDGNQLKRDIDYEAEEGSTKITIYSQTLSNAGAGSHTISVSFNQGGSLKKATHTVKVENSGGGSGSAGGGGSSTPTFYALSVSPTVIHGTVKLSRTSATKGTTILVTVQSQEGYEFDDIQVLDSRGNELSVSGSGNQYRFTMPGRNVTVYASFVERRYMVSPDAAMKNGTVQLSKNRAAEGDIVNIIPWPDGGYVVHSVTAVDEGGQQINLIGDISGYRFVMPACGVRVYAVFTRVLPFLDVYESQWFWDKICYVYENGIMSGTAENMFQPGMLTSRGMVVTTLYRIAGSPVTSNTTVFDDVPAESYYAIPAAWAYENQIVAGYGDHQFSPNSNITREELAVMLYHYIEYEGIDPVVDKTDLNEFADGTETSDFAIPAMLWACEAEMFGGYDDNTLKPKGELTRAELATVLMRLNEWVRSQKA